MKKQSRRVLTASVSNDVELDAGEEVIIKLQNVLERVPSSTARNADEEKRKRKRGQEVSKLIENLSAYERTKQSNLLARIDVDSLSKISSDKNSEMMKEVAETKKLVGQIVKKLKEADNAMVPHKKARRKEKKRQTEKQNIPEEMGEKVNSLFDMYLEQLADKTV